MSFNFDWPAEFPPSFYEHTKRALSQAMNSGGKLSSFADQIVVQDLHLGSIPPELDLLALDELSIEGGFRGRFMLSYSGDAFLTLSTNVQINPLTAYKHALELLATPSALLQTAQMLVELTLSHLRLRCIIELDFSKKTGLSLSFNDDPLESLQVSSSFDSISVVHQFIQTEIEHQLRERFRRDLPTMIHRLSQKWLADMGQDSLNSAPIIVEREPEREPDDSFHDPVSFPLSDHSVSPIPSDSEFSDSDDDDAAISRFGTSPIKTISRGHASPTSFEARSLPKRSALHTVNTDSPILQSLTRSGHTFAKTFSKPPEPIHNLDDLPSDLAAKLAEGNSDRKATRRRLHRLDSPSPQASPEKPRSKNRDASNVRIKRAELDEYFPVAPLHIPTSTRVQFGNANEDGRRRGRIQTASGQSLRRDMMRSRLRESNFFTPNYPS